MHALVLVAVESFGACNINAQVCWVPRYLLGSVAQVKGHASSVLSNGFLSPCVTIKWVCCVPRYAWTLSNCCILVAPSSQHTHIYAYTYEVRASPLLCCVPATPFKSLCAQELEESASKICCPWDRPLKWRQASTILGSVRKWHDYLLHPLLPGGEVIVFFPVSLVIGIAFLLHCIERDDYTNKHYVD